MSSPHHEDILENVMSDSRHSSEGGSNAICQIKNNSCFLCRFLSFCQSSSLCQRSITYHNCRLNVLSGGPYSCTLLEGALLNNGVRSDHIKISSLQGQSLFTHWFLKSQAVAMWSKKKRFLSCAQAHQRYFVPHQTCHQYMENNRLTSCDSIFYKI